MEERHLICIGCPVGCALTVRTRQGEVVSVEGNTCRKGKFYGEKEVTVLAGAVTSFQGNYSSYAEKKAQLRDAQYKAYLNQQREIKHQEAVIVKLKSFNREKSIRRAESHEKMLNKIQRIDKPVEIQTQMRLSLEPRVISGNDVLTVEGISKSFPGQTLFNDISFRPV